MRHIVALNKYYESHPPLHIMVAAYLGIGETKPKQEPQRTFDDFMAELSKEGLI